MKIRERVARAIAEAHLHGPNDPPFAFEALTEEVADEYYKMARAAIESLREPTEAMVEAGGEAYYGHPRASAVEWAKEDKFDLHAADAAIFYGAMVDAALKDNGEKA